MKTYGEHRDMCFSGMYFTKRSDLWCYGRHCRGHAQVKARDKKLLHRRARRTAKLSVSKENG